MFSDTLDIKLILDIDGEKQTIPGSHLNRFDLKLFPWGFSGEIDFSVFSREKADKLLPLFMDPKPLIKVELEISPGLVKEKPKEPFLHIKGLVREKQILAEHTSEGVNLKNDPVLSRTYGISFEDAASLLLGHHYPAELFTEKSIKEIVQAHCPKGVELKFDFPPFDEKHPMTALASGQYMEASFYDFLIWQLFENNGHLIYDYKKNSWLVTGKKAPAEKPGVVRPGDIENYRVVFPEPLRHKAVLLDTGAEKPGKKEICQDHAVEGIRRESPDRYAVTADFDAAETRLKKRFSSRESTLVFSFGRCPEYPLCPGAFTAFSKNEWSRERFFHGKKYRVRELLFRGSAAEADDANEVPHGFGCFSMELRIELEAEGDKSVRLPPCARSRYPLITEGLIVSETGEDDARTYQIYTDSKTSLETHKIKIPAWKEQILNAPFEPSLLTGHFYFPLCKGARVLVALGLHTARIERVLQWRDGARIPLESQGNRILMGKKEKNRTEITHSYLDNKPVFNITRTSDEETEEIKMGEGNLRIELK